MQKTSDIRSEKNIKNNDTSPLGLSARTPESSGIQLRNCKSKMSNNSYIQMGMDMEGNMFTMNVHFEKKYIESIGKYWTSE